MIVFIIDPKNSTRELLQVINTFSKLAWYKINWKKSVALLYYKNDKWTEKEIMETIPFTISTNKISWYNSNQASSRSILQEHQSLKKETEEDIRRWKDLPSSWLVGLTKWKWPSYQSNLEIQIQTPSKFQHIFIDFEGQFSTLYGKTKIPG